MKKIIAITMAVGSTLMVHGQAQVAGMLEQVDSVQKIRQVEKTAESSVGGDSAPELYPGETGDVGPQTVLSFHPHPTLVEVLVDAQYLHTDNMFLVQNGRQGADLLVSTVQLALAPKAYPLWDGKLAPRVGYRHEFFDYGLAKSDATVPVLDATIPSFRNAYLREFDFNAQTFFSDASWAKNNWTFTVGFDYRRLLTLYNFSEFYNEFVPRWAVARSFQLGDGRNVMIGYEGDYRFTHNTQSSFSTAIPTDLNDRLDESLFITFTQTLGKHLVLQPFYRLQYTDFTQGQSRNDILNTVGVIAYWYFTPKISARAYTTYDWRHSSESSTSDYEKLDAGIGLNLTFRF